MAMGSDSGRVIPPLTVRMARASNPRGTAAMWVRDRLDELFTDDDLSTGFRPVGGGVCRRPGWPWCRCCSTRRM